MPLDARKTSQSNRPARERRSVRYTLLLSPREMALAQQVADAEYRTLPDLLRIHIYKLALSHHLVPASVRGDALSIVPEGSRAIPDP